jgi:hypothetical protein
VPDGEGSESQRIVAEGDPDARDDFILGKLLQRDRYPPDLARNMREQAAQSSRQVLGR